MVFSREHRILVTGASSGIGQAIALRCNTLGATVIACGRNMDRLLAAKDRADHPEYFLPESRDLLSGMETLPEWVKGLRERHGKLGGFVHSAGTGLTAPLRVYDLEKARRLFDIHVHAPMLIAKGFADRRNNIGPGAAMVFMGSVSAVVPQRAKAVYASAKSAQITAASSLAKELASLGIRVNSISPALVETPMAEGFRELLGEESFAAEQEQYPFGLGRPEDIASLACFLLSGESRWITGQNMVMDGGRY
jgi:Dehydrogenases with different specificities (related to short-chain alcohol dehydrogenases)